MKKEYQIAAIVKIQAHSYEEALREAELHLTLKTCNNDDTVDLVYDYEDDNCGQRVVYLPGIDTTGPDAEDRDSPEYKEAEEEMGLSAFHMPDNQSHDYSCKGPFTYGIGVCLHGWNIPHTLSEREASATDRLTNCGLLPDRQRIEKYQEIGTDCAVPGCDHKGICGAI